MSQDFINKRYTEHILSNDFLYAWNYKFSYFVGNFYYSSFSQTTEEKLFA